MDRERKREKAREKAERERERGGREIVCGEGEA